MLKVTFGVPLVDTVRLRDSEYDIDCPKCKKTIFARRDNESSAIPKYPCPNCGSDISLVNEYFRLIKQTGSSGGDMYKNYFVCDNGCGWSVNNNGKDKLKHEDCGAEIGGNWIKSKSIEDYDIDENDPKNKFSWGALLFAIASIFKK
jgi:hypothetical protein